MKINEIWEDLKEQSHKNIESEKGILNRANQVGTNRRTFWRYQRK